MKDKLATTWNSIMDHRYNPLKTMGMAQRHYVMQGLAWMWSMIFSVSFLSIYVAGYVWLAHVLVITGVFVTVTVFKNAEARPERLAPAPYLSRASKCVWQMDREA